MKTPNIADLIAKLQQHDAAIGTACSEWNEKALRTRAAFHDTAQKLTLCICGLTTAPNEIKAEEARIVTLEEQRAIVLTKQTELGQQLAGAPDWQLVSNVRQRDAERVRQETLALQLHELRAGTLLVAPHQFYPRIEDLEARLKKSHERLERLRAQLAEHLQQAQGLLAATVTT